MTDQPGHATGPTLVAALQRLLMVLVLLVIWRWVAAVLGGVALSPTQVQSKPNTNDTGKLFNWHPLLMTLAFAVFMAEAVLAYRSSLVSGLDRPKRKRVHYICHTCALVCALLGVLAAWQSHSLKRPEPIPHLYSPHSYLGALTLTVVVVQFGVGVYAYLWPGMPVSRKLTLGPIHRFTGSAAWVLGLATMAVGIQEKTTFYQMGRGLQGSELFSAAVRLPAVAQLLLALLGIAVMQAYGLPLAQQQQAGTSGSAGSGGAGSSGSTARDDPLLRQSLLRPHEDDSA